MQVTARTYAKYFYRDKDLGTCQKKNNSKGAGRETERSDTKSKV